MTGAWLLVGGLVGLLNGLSRWWTVAQLPADMEGTPLLLTLGGMVLRLTLVAALLIAGLRQGILPGLLAFAGLWLARSGTVVWFQAAGVPWPCDAARGDSTDPPRAQRR
jgi:hypothetical protein